MKIKHGLSDFILNIVVYSFVIFLSVAIIVPFWSVFATSVTSRSDVSLSFRWFPKSVDWSAWNLIVTSPYMWKCFSNTVIRTVLGTVVHLFFLITFTYPLSIKEFPLRKFLMTALTITMFFSGGMIPTYLNISDLKLMDTVWALILPGALSAYNAILLKNYFEQLPGSLRESAKIDGANDILILLRIILPISLPIIATLALWTIVGQWNEWFNCVLYINERSKNVLPVMIRELQQSVASLTEGLSASGSTEAPPSEAIISASNLFVILPVICTYPFLQKYFIGGLTLGAVKG